VHARRTGLYATERRRDRDDPDLPGPGSVLYWQSDIDVDCDGGRTNTACAIRVPIRDEHTGADGMPIDAETVPFVVIPLPSARFRYADHAIDLGQLALVTYGDRWAIGVFATRARRGSSVKPATRWRSPRRRSGSNHGRRRHRRDVRDSSRRERRIDDASDHAAPSPPPHPC